MTDQSVDYEDLTTMQLDAEALAALVEPGGELAQFLLVGDAAHLEQSQATALETDRAAGVLGFLDTQGL